VSREVARLLFDSDRRYFAAGAEALEFAGGTLRWMPGLQHLAAGCLVEPARAVSPAEFACAAAEAVASVGAPLLRFYLPDPQDHAAQWAEERFVPAVELAFARRPEPLAGLDLEAVVRAVITQADWTLKERLASAVESLPDGKPASAADWTALERRKSDAAYAQFYLVELDGEPCGAFALADCGPLLRLKNLAVHPGVRRRGIGRTAIDFALRHARDNGYQWVGAFGLEGGAGSRLYTGCDFEQVGSQTEWTRPITE
jgi:GNAT superfamily N-acetyltransferase